jgi:hypothetical protein
MGSRGRSIRFRIYILVAIPLITMLGLFGYVAYTSVTNWLNLDRAPSLIKATSIPITNFVTFLQAERRAAIVYESQPTAANLAAYQATVTATKNGIAAFEQVINSPATTQNATASQTAAMTKMVTDVNGMSGLRAEVTSKKLDSIDTLEAYSEIVADQDNIFTAQAASMTDTTASSQGLGLISAVNAREDLSEQDAVLAGALAANSLTGPDRAAFGQAAGRQFDDTQLYERLLTPSELTSFNATMNQMAPPATIQANLTKIQDAVEADIPLSAMQAQGLSPATWQLLTSTWSKANYDSATNAAATTLGTDEGLATSAKNRVWVTAGVGLAGLILTLIVSLLLSRSINRRLSTLRRSALTLAEEQLPSVVSRLRRGESVDVAARWARRSTPCGRPTSGRRSTRPGSARASTTCSATWPGATSRCCSASSRCSMTWSAGPPTRTCSTTSSRWTTSPPECGGTRKASSSSPVPRLAGRGPPR